MGSNPGTVYWMDIFSSYICCKNCNDVCLKRPKINKKEAGVGPFLKNELTRRSQRIVLKSVMVIREYLKADSVLFENLKKVCFFFPAKTLKRRSKMVLNFFSFSAFCNFLDQMLAPEWIG